MNDSPGFKTDTTSQIFRQNIPALTGIRGVAAIVVVLHHAWRAAGGNPGIRGQWAVDLFFVLSGFVMSLTYLGDEEPVRWRMFYSSRAARIYPLYVITSIFMACVFVYGPFHPKGPSASLYIADIVRELTMTTAWPIVGGGPIWNDPTWSISAETAAYAVFTLLALTQRRTSARGSAFSVMFFAIILAWVLTSYAGSSVYAATRGWLAIARAVVEFAAGWASFRLYRETRFFLPSRVSDLLTVLLGSAILISGMAWRADAWYLIPLYPIFIMSLADAKTITSICLSSSFMVYLGDISFSIYLVHPIFLHVAARILRHVHEHENPLAFMTVTIALTIPASAATYILIEKPCRKWLRHALDPRDPPETKTARASF